MARYDNPAKAPALAGVYIIRAPDVDGQAFVMLGDVLYVGESKNIRNRLVGHPRLQQARRWGFKKVVIDVGLCDHRKYVEAELIADLEPLFNGTDERSEKPNPNFVSIFLHKGRLRWESNYSDGDAGLRRATRDILKRFSEHAP